MSKYTKEFKLKLVKEYLKGNIGHNTLARKYSIPPASLRSWINRYKEHGINGLEKNNMNYDGNFKILVVEYMHNNHLSLNETSTKFNLSGCHLVAKWERIYYEEGPQALFRDNRGRKNKMKSKPSKNINEMSKEELLKQNEYLRMENAYLKKLQALIQERENPPKKKK